MSRYSFSVSGAETRHEGVIESESFLAAVDALGEHVDVHTGDVLEIGVSGFPPARYECVGEVKVCPSGCPRERWPRSTGYTRSSIIAADWGVRRPIVRIAVVEHDVHAFRLICQLENHRQPRLELFPIIQIAILLDDEGVARAP